MWGEDVKGGWVCLCGVRMSKVGGCDYVCGVRMSKVGGCVYVLGRQPSGMRGTDSFWYACAGGKEAVAQIMLDVAERDDEIRHW